MEFSVAMRRSRGELLVGVARRGGDYHRGEYVLCLALLQLMEFLK